jgi:hypothetical protein
MKEQNTVIDRKGSTSKTEQSQDMVYTETSAF